MENGQAVLAVRDNGPGVPEDALPLLFKPFYRVDGSRVTSTGGMGLGLAIVRNAVSAHGGTVTARNVSPHGLEVELKLPLPAQPQRPDPRALNSSHPSRGSVSPTTSDWNHSSINCHAYYGINAHGIEFVNFLLAADAAGSNELAASLYFQVRALRPWGCPAACPSVSMWV